MQAQHDDEVYAWVSRIGSTRAEPVLRYDPEGRPLRAPLVRDDKLPLLRAMLVTMQRITILTLSLFTLTACVPEDEGNSDESTSASTGELSDRDLDELEDAWLALLESLHDQWRRGEKRPRGCINSALGMSCAHCSVSIIPPKLSCWVSTPLGDCSGHCDLNGLCGGHC